MNSHIQITFTAIEPEQQEWVIAHLAEAGYEGFEESDMELRAFITASDYDRVFLKELAYKYQLTFTEEVIEAQNWNKAWESSFEPVIVEEFVAVRAGFHSPVKNVEHEIVITPKMSFGTGHHATTFMMLQQMRFISFDDRLVFDFGTGTGVLAILAEKLGARKVIATDIDDWSIENAKENIQNNNCHRIDLRKADSAPTGMQFGVILANINKNVILDNMEILASELDAGGILLLSGLLSEDEEEIKKSATASLLVFAGKVEKDNWLCLKFVR